jgi:hypothetical protein
MITIIKSCILTDCIFIVAYNVVPSVLTYEVLTTESCLYQNFNLPGFSFNGYRMRLFSLLSPQW